MSGRSRTIATLAGTLALALAAIVSGCSRQRYTPLPADSTAVVKPDSFALVVRDAQQAWDQPAGGEEASRLTAALLLADLRAHAAVGGGFSWSDRARVLIDSLAIGAEIADARCAMVVNLFSRANPEQGSWPWLYWCGREGIEMQRIEGKGLRLMAVASRGLEPGAPELPLAPRVAAVYTRRAGLGLQPVLMAWSPTPGRAGWQLQQTLGPDSLGGVGETEFQSADTSVTLIARTFRPMPRFDECASCPHAWREARFDWRPEGFARVTDQMLPSPYATFGLLVNALAANDLELARTCVTDPALVEQAVALGFGQTRGNWRTAPGTSDRAREIVFLRGRNEAYQVRFARLGDAWKVEGIAATQMVIE
jgi:hypothetical protein